MDRSEVQTLLRRFTSIPKNAAKIETLIYLLSHKDPDLYRSIAYETLWDLSRKTPMTDLFSRLRGHRYGYDHPDMSSIHESFQEEEDFLFRSPDISEGVIECHRCGSKKTLSFSKQTRRADESATVFVSCFECHHYFRL